jgi:hypothetical protein
MPRFHVTTDDLPAGPPPEVLAQIDDAWERARELFASDLGLYFEVDDVLGRVWAELRDPDGIVAERFTAAQALDFACGDATLPLAVAA